MCKGKSKSLMWFISPDKVIQLTLATTENSIFSTERENCISQVWPSIMNVGTTEKKMNGKLRQQHNKS